MASFKKKYSIKTEAQKFFKALTAEPNVSIWSGAPAVMCGMENFQFSLWSGSIVGINKKVSHNELVQLWKEPSWKEYSEVRFVWEENENGIEVTLIHDDIPEESYKDVARGWDEHYMIPLTTWLESNNL